MNSNQTLAKQILDEIGGSNNIDNVNHCATRLRFNLRDGEKVKPQNLEKIVGVLGVVKRDNNVQVVIGPKVGSVYSSLIDILGHQYQNPIDEHLDPQLEKRKTFKLSSIVDFISGTFVPMLPILVAAGLVSAVLNILTTFFGLDASSGTVQILTAINTAGFFFLPIYLGFSAANKLGINTYMGAYLGAILISDAINGVEGLDFFGITVPVVSYANSVIPILLGVLFMYVVDRFFERITPKEISYFVKPLLTIIIVTPVTLILLGPLGNFLGGYLASGLLWINTQLGWFSVGLIGVLTPLLVMTGTNQALFPLVFSSLSEFGYDAFVMTGMLAANVAVGAAALATSIRLKDVNKKALSLSSGITGVMGITEPAIFGVLLPYKKPLYGAMIGGGIGGLFAGLVQLKQYAIVSPGIAALPTFIPTDGNGITANFWNAIVTLILSILVSFIVTYLLMKEGAVSSVEQILPSMEGNEEIVMPVMGKPIPLSEVNDEVFASGMMGKGFAVIPSNGNIQAPMDGEVILLAETQHAIGIRTPQGNEVLIHIGIDSVKLKGEGFHALVEVGQKVRQGDLLMKFQLDLLSVKGIDTTVVVLVTNLGPESSLDIHMNDTAETATMVIN